MDTVHKAFKAYKTVQVPGHQLEVEAAFASFFALEIVLASMLLGCFDVGYGGSLRSDGI